MNKLWGRKIILGLLATTIIFYGLGLYSCQKSSLNSISSLISAIYHNPAPDVDLNIIGQSVNNERTKVGLQELAKDPRLDAVAQTKCNDMVAKDYWSHNAPDGKTPWDFLKEAGISYATAGENLAYGFSDANSAVTGWMNSQGHKDNILNAEYTNVGYAQCKYAKESKEGYSTIVVQIFIKP